MLFVTAGLIYRDDGRLLIAQRPEGKQGALKWEFPGGKIEEDEDPPDCLRREVMEELGVVIDVGPVVDVVFHRYPDRSVLLLFYECRWKSGEPSSIGCKSFAWVKREELPGCDFLEADLDFIRRYSGSR